MFDRGLRFCKIQLFLVHSLEESWWVFFNALQSNYFCLHYSLLLNSGCSPLLTLYSKKSLPLNPPPEPCWLKFRDVR